jgi:colanic acid/amylovoran biosynthesis glycosyltransferase
MADGQTLLFIPQSWPFPDAAEDTFIGPELPHLAATFARIVVAPLQGNPTLGTTLGRRLSAVPGQVILDTRLLGSLRRRTSPMGVLRHIWGTRTGDDRGDAGLAARIARARLLAQAARIRRTLADLAASLKPSLLYTYWFDAATIAASQLGLATVTRAHGYDLYEDRHALSFHPLRRWALDHLHLVACVSEHGRRHIAELHPGHDKHCEVHRLGVPDEGRRGVWDETRIALVSCSAAVPLKRLARIAEVAHLAARQGDRPVHWCHIGGGPGLPELRRTLAQLKHPRLSWELAGELPATAVRTRMCAERPLLFLNQSSTEGVPAGVMEAFSCGIPVCASAVGGVPEIVDDGNGLLHARDAQVADVATAICALAREPARQRRMADAAHATWMTMCDPAINHGRFAARLRSIAQP